MAGIIDKILGGGAKGLLDGIKGILDEVITNKEELAKAKLDIDSEVNRHEEALARLDQEELLARIQNAQGAREANVAIQGTAPSWLAKNVAYMIDILLTVCYVAATTYLMCVMLDIAHKNPNVDYTAVTAIWGGFSAMFGTVLNFHRGSSAEKSEKWRRKNEK